MKWKLAAACLMLAPALAGDPPDLPPNLPKVQASPDDCAIFALLAKAKLGWTAATPPEGNYIFESTIAHGASETDMGSPQTFVAQCPWRDLGLAEPVSNPEGGAKNYAFGYPIRSTPALAHATWNRFEFVTADGRTDLHQRYQLCKFVKQDGQWQIESCEDEKDIIRSSQPEKQ